MALRLANIQVETREISLREKPRHMLQVSPKGTVPVLILPDGKVIDQSLDIMLYAYQAHALEGSLDEASRALIEYNDSYFKDALDAYKYPERYPQQSQDAHRAEGERFLLKLENLLQRHEYLFGPKPGLVDMAIFPFIRQFAAVDRQWFENAPYPKLHVWMNRWLESALFNSVMEKRPTYVE